MGGYQIRRAFASIPFTLLLLLILNCSILQANAQVATSPPIRSSGMINYNPTPADGWLHTDGFYIKDAAGKTVAWRGFIFEWQAMQQYHMDIGKAHGMRYAEIGFVPDRPANDWYLDVTNPTHLSRLDSIIDMCEDAGIYVILSCLDSSTNRVNDGLATGLHDAVPIEAFKVLVQRYADKPVVAGVKFLDEINGNHQEEEQLYLNAIDALKPYNPNLLWVGHYIIYQRYTHTTLNPWWDGIPEGYDNIIMDAGTWLGHLNNPYPANFVDTDYATADIFVDDVIDKISTFQARVPIPCGMAYGTTHTTSDTAYTYAIRELNRKLEANRMYPCVLLSSYMCDSQTKMQSVTDRFMPDAPYPQYW